MRLDANEVLFGKIYPYIVDDNVTDIKWNGRNLWINDLNKGRYIAKDDDGNPLVLDDEWTEIFTTKLANAMNINFNSSRPSLMAETDELRIQAVHQFVSGEHKMAIAIRKTPSIARLNTKNLVADRYMDTMTHALLPCIIHARLSGAIIGDVGAGKTELEKYLAQFIPEMDGVITVEDTLEMKLSKIYPEKDIYSIKITTKYTAEDAIRDALRLLTKWLILSEARGREIQEVMEAASTGCTALTSIHAENTWEIPDRMVNMAGSGAREDFESNIYAFFDYAIKVKAEITKNGIKRCIDQISFFDRTDGVNSIVVFYKDGKLTGNPLPKRLVEKFEMNNEKEFLDMYHEYFDENNKMIPAAFGIHEITDKEYGKSSQEAKSLSDYDKEDAARKSNQEKSDNTANVQFISSEENKNDPDVLAESLKRYMSVNTGAEMIDADRGREEHGDTLEQENNKQEPRETTGNDKNYAEGLYDELGSERVQDVADSSESDNEDEMENVPTFGAWYANDEDEE